MQGPHLEPGASPLARAVFARVLLTAVVIYLVKTSKRAEQLAPRAAEAFELQVTL